MGGSLKSVEWIKKIKSKYPGYEDIECFIETGTYHCGTTFLAASCFKTVHTIELGKQLYENAISAAKKKGIKNITFHNGDSGELISKLCADIKEPAVFFLDGHYCGDGRGSVKSSEGNPLLKEVAAINNRSYADVIIVDDYWLFGKNVPSRNLDWTDITNESIMSCLDKDRVIASHVHDDRFIIWLKGLK